MAKVSAELLTSCVDDVRSGRLTVEDCVEAHPAQAEELRSLLATALAIELLPADPDAAFNLSSRTALVRAISAETKTQALPFWQRFWAPGGKVSSSQPAIARRGFSAVALAVFTIIVLVGLLGGGAAYAAQSALPDDPLYPVKTAVEAIQLGLAPGDTGKAQASLDCATKRLDEVQAAIALGRLDASRTAAEGYVQCVAAVEQHLSAAANSGKDITDLASRLSATLASQEARLEAIESSAPAPARPALSQAASQAASGLARASDLAHGKNKPEDNGNTGNEAVPGTVPAGPAAGTPAPGQRRGEGAPGLQQPPKPGLKPTQKPEDSPQARPPQEKPETRPQSSNRP